MARRSRKASAVARGTLFADLRAWADPVFLAGLEAPFRGYGGEPPMEAREDARRLPVPSWRAPETLPPSYPAKQTPPRMGGFRPLAGKVVAHQESPSHPTRGVCADRAERREVLFSAGVAGSRGPQGPRVFSPASKVHCKR